MSSFFHETINLHREGKTIDDIVSIVRKSRDEVIDDIASYRLYNMKNFLDVVDDETKMSIKLDIINNYVLKLDKIEVVEYKQRAIDMVKLADQGLTYEQIAQLHNITRERVRQILIKYAPYDAPLFSDSNLAII